MKTRRKTSDRRKVERRSPKCGVNMRHDDSPQDEERGSKRHRRGAVEQPSAAPEPSCSFCHRSLSEVTVMLNEGAAYICEHCAVTAVESVVSYLLDKAKAMELA